MQPDEWFHPDIANKENPSENETFRLIANVLESGNVDCYKPTKSPIIIGVTGPMEAAFERSTLHHKPDK